MLKFKNLHGKLANQVIKYSFLNKQDADQASEFISKKFCNKQPLCVNLGVQYRQFKCFADQLLLNQRLKKTFVAKSQTTNKIIGISVSQSPNDSFQFKSQMGQKLKTILSLLEMMSANFINQFKCQKKTIFNMLCVAVDQKYEGLGIALDLMNNSIILAKSLGYQYLTAELTAPATKFIWTNKLKFQIHRQYLFKDLLKQLNSELIECKFNDKILMGYKNLNELII